MSTRLQLRTRVRQYLDETNEAYWTDVEINNWINQSYFYYYNWIVQSFEGYFTKDILINIVAGQAKYPVPSDFFKVKLLEQVIENKTQPLTYFDRLDSPNYTSGIGEVFAVNFTYRFEGRNIVLEPTPTSNLTGGLRLEYISTPTGMSTDGSSPDSDFLEMWEEAIVIKAALSCKAKEEAVVGSGSDLSSLQQMLQGWEQIIKESCETRTLQRTYTQPFGLPDTGY